MTDTEKTNDAPNGLSESKATLNRCETCRYFDRYTEDVDIKYHGSRAGLCDCDKFSYDAGQKPKVDGLRYWDYEGYSAGFNVGERFGCIHWTCSDAKIGGVPHQETKKE